MGDGNGKEQVGEFCALWSGVFGFGIWDMVESLGVIDDCVLVSFVFVRAWSKVGFRS